MACPDSYFVEIDVKDTVLGEKYYLVFNTLKMSKAGFFEVNGIMAFPISMDGVIYYVNEYIEGLPDEVMRETKSTLFYPEAYMVERTESNFIPNDMQGEFLVIIQGFNGADYNPPRYYVWNCANVSEVMDCIESELEFRKHIKISDVIVFKQVQIDLHYQISGLFDAEECESELNGEYGADDD